MKQLYRNNNDKQEKIDNNIDKDDTIDNDDINDGNFNYDNINVCKNKNIESKKRNISIQKKSWDTSSKDN